MDVEFNFACVKAEFHQEFSKTIPSEHYEAIEIIKVTFSTFIKDEQTFNAKICLLIDDSLISRVIYIASKYFKNIEFINAIQKECTPNDSNVFDLYKDYLNGKFDLPTLKQRIQKSRLSVSCKQSAFAFIESKYEKSCPKMPITDYTNPFDRIVFYLKNIQSGEELIPSLTKIYDLNHLQLFDRYFVKFKFYESVIHLFYHEHKDIVFVALLCFKKIKLKFLNYIRDDEEIATKVISQLFSLLDHKDARINLTSLKIIDFLFSQPIYIAILEKNETLSSNGISSLIRLIEMNDVDTAIFSLKNLSLIIRNNQKYLCLLSDTTILSTLLDMLLNEIDEKLIQICFSTSTLLLEHNKFKKEFIEREQILLLIERYSGDVKCAEIFLNFFAQIPEQIISFRFLMNLLMDYKKNLNSQILKAALKLLLNATLQCPQRLYMYQAEIEDALSFLLQFPLVQNDLNLSSLVDDCYLARDKRFFSQFNRPLE